MSILLYIVAIVTANVLTSTMQPLVIGPFIVTAGTFLIGATFMLRDLVQHQHGRRKTYGVIFIALIMSAILSKAFGDILWIVFASALSFAISESTDTEIYTRLKLPIHYRVAYSGIVGGFLDSVVFVVIGLSPIGAGFIPWSAVPMAIAGQVIIKTVMQGIGAFGIVLKNK